MNYVCPNCGTPLNIDENVVASLREQVRTAEFNEAVEVRVADVKEKAKAEVEILRLKLEHEQQQALLAKDEKLQDMAKQVALLEAKIKNCDTATQLAVTNAVTEKEQADKKVLETIQAELQKKINELNEAKVELANKEQMALIDKENAILALDKERGLEVGKKDGEISNLKAEILALKNKHMQEKQDLGVMHAREVAMLNEEVQRYKDFKLQLSTKAIGESLEQYCQNQFNNIRMTAYRNATFEKDTVVKDGTKGDYIFREETDDAVEYISIMFEMKNEADDTDRKHKNEEFFAKLDKDRRNKGCEYAVLVSMLEPDNDYYNDGIVEVYQYEKMYVVRPQFFLPIISILRNAAGNNIEIRRELIETRLQQTDFSNFEENLGKIQSTFEGHCKAASNHYEKAVKVIDANIDAMVKLKEELRLMVSGFGKANNNLQEISVKKLTHNALSVRAQIEAARK